MRTPGWMEIKKLCEKKLKLAQGELMTAPLDQIERARGRIEIINSILALEHGDPDIVPDSSFME